MSFDERVATRERNLDQKQEKERARWMASKKGKVWVSRIKALGRFTCVGCGLVDGAETKHHYTKETMTVTVCAHHIWGFHERPDWRGEIRNGVVLCKSCHGKLHYWAGNMKHKFGRFNAYLRQWALRFPPGG